MGGVVPVVNLLCAVRAFSDEVEAPPIIRSSPRKRGPSRFHRNNGALHWIPAGAGMSGICPSLDEVQRIATIAFSSAALSAGAGGGGARGDPVQHRDHVLDLGAIEALGDEYDLAAAVGIRPALEP